MKRVSMQRSQIFRLGCRTWRSVMAFACAIFAFLGLTFLATGVQATIIFDNFDSTGGFSSAFNLVAAAAVGSSDLAPEAIRAAAEFTVTGGDFNLSSITLPISFQGTGPNNTLQVLLTTDNSGAPGTTLEVLSANQIIWPNLTNPFTAKTTLTSAGHPLLSDGDKYWIVTELTSYVDADQYVDYRWFLNTSGATVPCLQQHTTDGSLPADPWPGSFNKNVAFQVEGTPVPIPAPFWLLGSGLLGLGGLGWRRKMV